MTQDAYFLLLTHTKQLLLLTFCDTTTGIEPCVQPLGHMYRTVKQTEGQTDVEIEIVI